MATSMVVEHAEVPRRRGPLLREINIDTVLLTTWRFNGSRAARTQRN